MEPVFPTGRAEAALHPDSSSFLNLSPLGQDCFGNIEKPEIPMEDNPSS